MGRSRTDFNDLALELAVDVFGLEDLHFGWFEDGEPVTWDSLRTAQRRYTDRLLAELPVDARRVLDVGCGTGVILARLAAEGRDVEGISPDEALLAKARARTAASVPLHLGRFEDFSATRPFDAVLMAESCQYVKRVAGLASAARALRPGGVLLAADVFRMRPLDAPHLSRAGHRHANYLDTAAKAGFDVEVDRDITAQTAPTLALYHEMLSTRVIPALDAAARAATRWRPWISRALGALFGRKLALLRRRYLSQDPVTFAAYRSYRLIRLRKRSGAERGRRDALPCR